MFQSVTYTGFEKHPERRAWVEGVVMPLVAEVLRRESGTLTIRWHDPDLAEASGERLEEVVREDVLREPGERLLVGQIDGTDAEDYHSVSRPGVLFVLETTRLPTGWAYLLVPSRDHTPSVSWLKWLIRSAYLTMLSASLSRMVDGFGDDDLEPAGV